MTLEDLKLGDIFYYRFKFVNKSYIKYHRYIAELVIKDKNVITFKDILCVGANDDLETITLNKNHPSFSDELSLFDDIEVFKSIQDVEFFRPELFL